MKKIGVILSVLVLLLAGSAYSHAATTESAPAAVSVSLKPKLTISVVPAAVAFGDMEPATSSEKDPAIGTYAVKVNVKSNEPWNFTYGATDFSTGTNNFTVDHLAYKLDADGAYTNFASTGSLGTNIGRGSRTYDYDYKLTFQDTDADWQIPSGAYSSTVTYTAAQ